VHKDIYEKMVERMAFKVGSGAEIRRIVRLLYCRGELTSLTGRLPRL